MDSPNIMSIREIIDAAFGEENANTVNHKLIQTILVILARQLRMLERRVAVEIGPIYNLSPSSSLSVTEVKIQANVPKKTKAKPGQRGKAKEKNADNSDLTTQEKSDITEKSTKSTRKSEKSSSDKTSTTAKSATQSSTEKSASYKTTTTDMSNVKSETNVSSDKIKSSADKDFFLQPETGSASKVEPVTIKSADNVSSLTERFQEILDAVEISREKELRVIRQRADSHEEYEKTPTPMASLTSTEKQYEKLLVVERVPKQDTKLLSDRLPQTSAPGRTPQLSIVTQTEFEELVKVVQRLQRNLIPVGTPGFPENAQLLDDLRKGASLTDAMAALQLSARLEAAEKSLEKMLSLVTDLANATPRLEINAVANKYTQASQRKSRGGRQEMEVLFPADTEFKEPDKLHKSEVLEENDMESEATKDKKDWIGTEELDSAMQGLHDELIKAVNNATSSSNTNANTALMMVNKLETKLDEALNLGDRIYDLENAVAEYAEQINSIDTELSSQMTNYQEQLTQMQHDLEVGIETMQEALANTGGDTAAVAELNSQFISLQSDFDVATTRQKELKDIQDIFSLDLRDLWKQIEILRDTKSDRDEVADALRDKAGLAALNGLVSRQEFSAVQGDFQKHIGAAYDKFNNQETVWQKAIDELIRTLNEKADQIQLLSLQDSITRYLEKIRSCIKDMMEIVGEPRAAAVSRKLHRDTACLSCSTPAHMVMEESKTIPKDSALPSSLASVGGEAKTKPKEDGDGICYPGLPIPHPIDPRSHICHRYCGGSHTLISGQSRVPTGMIVSPIAREINTEIGIDGKVYLVDHNKTKKPCMSCNYPEHASEPSEAELAQLGEECDSSMTPSDYYETAIARRSTDEDQNNTTLPPMSD